MLVRPHQAEALVHSLRSGYSSGRNPVVTSGTGSGKTEAFLLPVLGRVVAESLSWPEHGDLNAWWGSGDSHWSPVRSLETRPSALRSLILYPTNALVEDQITRLRRSVRAIRELSGRQVWFGRYTSATMGSGDLPLKSNQRSRDVSNQLREIVRDYDSLARLESIDLNQFSDPRTGEMLCRWDMVADPPDIMVTNYSMLNAMLMRDIEQPIFEKTRAWLSSDAANVFTLVVDELHLYRGTQGSEVAMIVRSLLHRLDLEPDSPQVRCVATSASLGGGEVGYQFLEQFFGIDRAAFHVTAGQPAAIIAGLPISRSRLLASASEEPAAVVAAFDLGHAVAAACIDQETGDPRATRMTDIATKLFDEEDVSTEALQLALSVLGATHGAPGTIPFRAHMFARTLRGLWACSNPQCDQSGREEELGIGRLFSIPASTCRCGGRVLELLYCFECGDVSLGGYVTDARGDGVFLGASPSSVAEPSTVPVYMRPHRSYRWYRPGQSTSPRTWIARNAEKEDVPVGLHLGGVRPHARLHVLHRGKREWFSRVGHDVA